MIDLSKEVRLPKLPTMKEYAVPPSNPAPFDIQNLDSYEGEWTCVQAAQLLRRCVFGASKGMIQNSVEMGLESTLDALFSGTKDPDPPLNFNYENDPEVPIGETWINANFNPALNNNYRNRSIRGWMMGLMLKQEISIIEKMVLFWHNHFVVAAIGDARFLYQYIDTLRENCLGDFKELTKKITIDPAMLRYLNGNQNTFEAPNENYARELLELFTIGKGDLAGPGDYTTFTETDVEQMAKVLTGWRDFGYRRIVDGEMKIGSFFRANRHTPGNKQLSHRFNNTTINNQGDEEYSSLVDIIFEQDEVSRFICRKLYRWFLYYDISPEIEQDIIEPMAKILRDNDYVIEPALRALLSSNHFFDENLNGCMIKSPIDFVMGLFNQFEIYLDLPLNPTYRFWYSIFEFNAILQMQYFNHPNVAGWKAYYQEPAYYRSWINSVTLPIRQILSDVLSYVGFGEGDSRVIIDVFKLAESLENPLDVNSLIEEIAAITFPKKLSEEQVGTLKEVILPGLPDFEWTVEYSTYLANPDDEEMKKSIEQKLRLLLVFMFRMPEYHLC